ncbi:MAG TPA: hypothetical protein VFW19_07075 [Allosphingosinicella sp.]|nr:hypothetical protein [Allosphingosinicella sp.]
MSGTSDHSRAAATPFLIVREGEGSWRLSCRDTRYNSQGYPIVTTTRVEELFETANAARAHAKRNFGAQPGQFASK